jgi:hypothetical protein
VLPLISGLDQATSSSNLRNHTEKSPLPTDTTSDRVPIERQWIAVTQPLKKESSRRLPQVLSQLLQPVLRKLLKLIKATFLRLAQLARTLKPPWFSFSNVFSSRFCKTLLRQLLQAVPPQLPQQLHLLIFLRRTMVTS